MNLRNGFLIAAISIIIFGMLLLAVRNTVIKRTVTQAVKQTFGVEINTESMSTGLLNSDLKIENIAVKSPEGFNEEFMVKIRGIYLNYDVWPLLRRRIHATDLEIALEEITVVKNPQGLLNVDEFRKRLKSSVPKAARQEDNLKEVKKHDRVLIDLLSIDIDRVVYKDYSCGPEAKVISIPVNIRQLKFQNIRSSQDLLEKVISLALQKASLGYVAELLGLGKSGLSQQDTGELLKSVLKGLF